mmetsp:Transcript_42319/g.69771  ORF Transcript_42319/g.69771 Transcript_42319/m.69771 type:complete len:1066 (-) Transcript_42319:132-3329(-)
MAAAASDHFQSRSIMQNDASLLLSPASKHRESIKHVKGIGNALTEEQTQLQNMCGYTIWVQWCDSAQLHGYYHCVGLRNSRYHFRHRRDAAAELFADDKGHWYLMYDGKCLYKSKRGGHDDPPPRNWKCIEGSLPPPGVSQVSLPDDNTPMVILEEEADAGGGGDGDASEAADDEGDDETTSAVSGWSRQTTVERKNVISPKTAMTATAAAGGVNPYKVDISKSEKKKKDKAKKKKAKKNKAAVAQALRDEFEVEIEVLEFAFDGSRPVAFNLNIGRHMEVTKVKSGGQAEQLGVYQGDLLQRINEENVATDWEKATGLLRSLVQNKQRFSITFARRCVEHLAIKVVRAGCSEYNGMYRFHKRDAADDMCPIYVKNDHDEEFDFSGVNLPAGGGGVAGTDGVNASDPLVSSSTSVHVIQRVYSNPENSEALWVLKNTKDEHYYMCVTQEYLPPQHGWELVPESEATYPAPGLQFMSSKASFDKVKRLTSSNNQTAFQPRNSAASSSSSSHSGGSNSAKSARKNLSSDERKQDDDDEDDNGLNGATPRGEIISHDALNVSNRNRTNKHRHEKTLTRMRATLGGAKDFNQNLGGGQRSASGFVPGIKSGYMSAAGKRAGFGSRLFGGKKSAKQQQQAAAVATHQQRDDNESASETEEESVKLEAIWKQKLEATTKNAINALTSKHQAEITQKEKKVEDLNETATTLRNQLQESQEYYYQMYGEKCDLSLILQEKQLELTRAKQKQKEMGKRYFQQQQRNEELESRLNDLSQTFTSRMSAMQAAPSRHQPTQSTVHDLQYIEQQFRDLLSSEHGDAPAQANGGGKGKAHAHHDDDDRKTGAGYLEDEIIKLQQSASEHQQRVSALTEQNDLLRAQNASLQHEMSSKQGGVDAYYTERTTKLTTKVSAYQQNIYSLMALLQNVEQEYMTKCGGKLPKATLAVDWRNAYDPKKYKQKHTHVQTLLDQSTTDSAKINGTGSAHEVNATFVFNEETQNAKKNKKKHNKKKRNEQQSATESIHLPHDQRWAGFNLGGAADDDESEMMMKTAASSSKKPTHRKNKENESRIIDL